jgi:NAD dependent epimerase/dehydratase
MEIKDKRVLVTGAGGFIGSHLTETLVRLGARVRAFVHYNSRNDWGMLEFLPRDILAGAEVMAGDVQDPFFVRRAVKGCNIVFHLAALIGIPYSYLAPKQYARVNVEGTLNILQACLDEEVEKVIHTSTSEVYGTARYVPMDEGHPISPQSPYAASKAAADRFAQSYYLSFGLPVVIIRPFNTFGPRQSARAVIPTIICQALWSRESCSTGQAPERQAVKLGSLEPVRDLTYVKDTVDGFLQAAAAPDCAGDVFNIGTSQGVSVGELVKTVSGIINKELYVETEKERIRPEKSEVMELICDYSKAREVIGWEPRYSLERGLTETIEWVESHLSRYKADIYNV